VTAQSLDRAGKLEKRIMEPRATKMVLHSWADQLKTNALLLELAKKYIPHDQQEQLEEVEKAVIRSRELAERAKQKAKELAELQKTG